MVAGGFPTNTKGLRVAIVANDDYCQEGGVDRCIFDRVSWRAQSKEVEGRIYFDLPFHDGSRVT